MSELYVQLGELEHIRGIRNNNPLNLRKGKGYWWDGEIAGTDPDFCTFRNMTMGFRAAFRTLDTYYHAHKLYSLRQIINRFAPPVENDTEAYVKAVSKWAGIDPDEVLPSPRNARDKWIDIVFAMTAVECTPNAVRCLAVVTDMAVGYARYLQSIQMRSHA